MITNEIVLKAYSAIFVSIICAILYFIGFVSLSERYHPLDPHIDTTLSATFSLEYFNKIKKDDDIDKVIQRLGQPLDFCTYQANPAYLFSSDGKLLPKSKGRSYWDFAWIGYYVEFDEKTRKVKNTYYSIHYD